MSNEIPLACPCNTNPVHYFDGNTRKPCRGTCGHSLCLKCVETGEFSTCPICKLEGAFNSVSVDYASISLIEDCREMFWEKFRNWKDTKHPGAFQRFYSELYDESRLICSICDQPVKIPRICFTCDNDTIFKRDRWQWKQDNAFAPNFIQCVMCADCAIDNHKMKKHKVIDKKSIQLKSMAIAQKVLDMFKDAIDNSKSVIDCFLRRYKIEMIGRKLLKLFEELEYTEEGQCGYLGELVKKELIQKYMENVDEKMLDLFGAEGNAVCDCSRLCEKLKTDAQYRIYWEILELVCEKPQFFESGCPLYSCKYIADVCRNNSISEKEFSGVATEMPPNNINCPLCVYSAYSQHQKKEYLLKSGVSIIGELCKTELMPLDKCCLKCLDRLNDCQFLSSCEHKKKILKISGEFTITYLQKKRWKRSKRCYQNCFMKNSELWNFVIINHMMADDNLHEVIMYEIDQTDGFVDCQLRKVRMKETINELYKGLNSFRCWEYVDLWCKPIEVDALLKSFKQQWNYFRLGSGEQKAASQCECTVIWNKISENKVEKEKCEDLQFRMIEMASYSMTEEIHGCPMEYIELNKDIMEELEKTVDFESTGEEGGLTFAGNEEVKYFMEKIVSNMLPFAHLHCQNEEEQLYDNKAHLPYTGSCGHTVCSRCIETALNGGCPVCGEEGSFHGQKVNEDLLREIEIIKRNAWDMFKELWKREAADFGACSECYKSTSDLYIFYEDDCDKDSQDDRIDSHSIAYLRVKNSEDVLRLSRQLLCKKCASAQTCETEKIDSYDGWKNYLKKDKGKFLLKLLEDETWEGVSCEHVEIQKTRKKIIKVLEELIYVKEKLCGYDTELIKLRLIEKLIESLDRIAKQQKPTEEKNCPLCVMIDYLDCARDTSERNRNDWMNVLEHLYDNQLAGFNRMKVPRFEKCCIRCLLYLNNRYESGSCQTEITVERIREMSNAFSEGIEEDQICKFQEIWTWANMECKDQDNKLDDSEILQNLILQEYFFCLIETITVGLSKTTFACHLQKIIIYNLALHLFSVICDTWYWSTRYWIVCWRFIRTSSILENLKIQFKKLKDELDEEKTGHRCECNTIWERIQRKMEELGNKECEEKRNRHLLENSMEETARFSPEQDLDGCSMDYVQQFLLNKEKVRLLNEDTDLEAETNKNKCLCVRIDSYNSKISDANPNQVVQSFINWWKHETSYPHSLCTVCMHRLNTVHHKLGTVSGFYNCQLRKKRILKTFEQLSRFIQDFHLRIDQYDVKEMAKVFENFIAQWKLFWFGSVSDQRSSASRTVCHCIKTLGTWRSLLYLNYEEVRREYNLLMETSAGIYLFEIRTGCPLDFDTGVDCLGNWEEKFRYFESWIFDSTSLNGCFFKKQAYRTFIADEE